MAPISTEGQLIGYLFHGIENGIINQASHQKICKSLMRYYERNNCLSQKQLGWLVNVLSKYDIPSDIPPKSFRSSKRVFKNQTAKTIISRVVPYSEDFWKLIFQDNEAFRIKVRFLPGIKYNENAEWIVPKSMNVIKMLVDWGFKIHPVIKRWRIRNEEESAGGDIPGLKLPLMPFQRKGVEFIDSRGGRAIIADEMGLGKTPQALAWLQAHLEARPALIVSPASLKWNWYYEAHKFMENPSVQVLSGKVSKTNLFADIIIVNYDILPDTTEKYKTGRQVYNKSKDTYIDEVKRRAIPGTGWWSLLKNYSPEVLIVDECHMIKDKKSLRTKAVHGLAKSIPFAILLSGTLMVNRPSELFSPLSLIDPRLFPNFFDFGKRYCGGKKGRFGWDFSRSTNQAELHDILTSTVLIRRLKKDVLPELPSKVRSVIPLDITNRSTYDKAQEDFLSYLETVDIEKLDSAKGAPHLVKIAYLKKLAATGKINACVKWISEFLESGQKLVVFIHHKEIMDILEEKFSKICAKVDGGVSSKKRQSAVRNFQENDKIKLFLGNLKAASEGLTLTAASHTCFIEFPWSPGTLIQAEDRVHRIGQKADSVNAWYLVGKDTIDEQIMQLIESKAIILEAVLDGVVEDDGDSIFHELLTELKS